VEVHYSAKLDDGTVLDCSWGHLPFQFRIGEGEVLQAFEESVIGMFPGETKTARISPEKGFGPYRWDHVAIVNRSELPLDPDLEPEMQIRLLTEDNRERWATVLDISEGVVTLDVNHPLAGEALIFDIHLLAVF
jgi:peptidylprolyl isomerase